MSTSYSENTFRHGSGYNSLSGKELPVLCILINFIVSIQVVAFS